MSYSQIGQDIFVKQLFNSEGFFLDFGCGNGRNEPCGNNTLYLEENGWDGVSIDINENYVRNFNATRKTKAYAIDLTKVDILEQLIDINCPKVIDYFSFDIDEATDNVLPRLPFDDFKFKFITFEHNLYSPEYKLLKDYSVEIFKKNGYQFIFENVVLKGFGAVEDWYIHPDYFDFPCLGQNVPYEEANNILNKEKI